MKFGYVVPNNFGVEQPTQLVELAVLAESLGFDSVWVNHHIFNAGYVHDRLGMAPYHDALVTLAWIGAATQSIRIGTSVLVMPYLHPMVLAKELATLDQLCGGRLIVGLGVGSNPEEHALLDVVPYADRGRYSDEFIAVLKNLWTSPRSSFSGEFFHFSNAVSSPKPQQRPHPPIWVGGNRPPALRRVARFADGWHALNLSPDSVAKRLARLTTAAESAGRERPPAVSVRLDIGALTPETVAAYAAVGVTELVVSLASGDVDANILALEQFAARHTV